MENGASFFSVVYLTALPVGLELFLKSVLAPKECNTFDAMKLILDKEEKLYRPSHLVDGNIDIQMVEAVNEDGVGRFSEIVLEITLSGSKICPTEITARSRTPILFLQKYSLFQRLTDNFSDKFRLGPGIPLPVLPMSLG